MAEQETAVAEIEAQEEAPDTGKEKEQPDVAALEQRLGQRIDQLEDVLYQTNTQLRGLHSRTDSAHTILASMQESLEEKYAPKRALAILEKIVRNSPELGDDAWERFEHDGELDELRSAVKQRTTPTPDAKPAGRDYTQEWREREGNRALTTAKRKGLDQSGYDKARAAFTKGIEDFRGDWTEWHLAFGEHMDDFVERATPLPSRTEVDNSKGGSASKKTWKDAQNIKNIADLSDKEYFELVES